MSTLSPVLPLRARLAFEASIVWQLIYKDLPASVGIGVMWSIVAWRSSAGALSALPLVALKSLLYFVVYVLPHCIANQINGVEEDRVNKPWRVLPSGQLSMRQMWTRLFVSFAVFLAVGLWLGVFLWALAWSVVVVLNNFGKATHRWYVKDLWMGVGMFVLMSPAWQIVAPISSQGMLWSAVLSVAVFVLVPMQDLRDMSGDRVCGRVTFPLAFGEVVARGFLACFFLVIPALFFAMMARAAWTPGSLLFWLALSAWAWVLAHRVWFRRSTTHDHLTYQAFCWWFVGWEGAALFVL